MRLSVMSMMITIAIASSSGFVMADHTPKHQQKLIDHGRYLVKIAGCNDCHTAGYSQQAGKVPESEWLKGDRLGWKGAWGTTYASNLRLVVGNMSEAEWLKTARTAQYRPPMPWFTLREMPEKDLKAIYQYIKHLGVAGETAPAYLPPDKQTPPPYVLFP